MRLIDQHYGLDLYLLETPDIDLCSKLALKLKRLISVSLANRTYYPHDKKKQDYIAEKYKRFVLPPTEAEWVALSLNEAAEKLQDIEEESRPMPKKLEYEQLLVEQLKNTREELGDAAKDKIDAKTELDALPSGSTR